MDLITSKNFKNVEPGLIMNVKTDGKNIITEYEINKSISNSSSKQNIKQKNQKITTGKNKIKNNISKKSNNKKKSGRSTVNNNKNTKVNKINKVSQDDIIKKKREKNNYAARKSREKKRLFIENLQKDLKI